MIRVFLADDHALVREGLKRLVDRAQDLEVVGEAADGDEVLRAYQPGAWDVLVLDLSLPGRSGYDVVQHLRARDDRLKILIVSMQPEDTFALRLLQAGADGYLSKTRSPDEILDGIRKVATEGKYVTPKLAELLLTGPGSQAPAHASLTDRELDVLMMVGRGKTPSDIANDLGLSPSTVSTHLHRIKTKLGAKSLGEIVHYAVQAGLVPLNVERR